MSELQIVVALYGDSHEPYAQVLLESLRRIGHSKVLLVRSGFEADNKKDRVAHKLSVWGTGFDQCLDGDDVVFLDADTMVMKPLSPVFGQQFDVAHTIRHDRKWKINSGVIFVRASEKTRRWFRTWRDMSRWAYSLEEQRQAAIGQWGHVDQATLPASLAMCCGYDGLKVKSLPAEIWNEDRVTESPLEVAIYHFKGVLDLLLKPYEASDYGDQRLRREQFDHWRELYETLGR